jgi:predicted Zn-dependent protease
MAMLGQVTSASGEGPPEWLSTHPNPANREETIIEMADEAEVAADPALVRREEYLPRLDGMIYGENPREGFFEGSRFYHPDMAFQFEFPDGWQTANSKQAVQAGSPEGDAIMGLTLGEGSSPADALDAFLAQEGLESGQRSNAAINGIPAAGANFRATTADGVLRGRVVFLNHQGILLRFLGFTTEQAWQSRGGAIRASLESFRPLTDRSKLDVEPARLRVVTVSRATDLATLLNREGATSRAEDVRILNRLEGNPTLPAGRVVKIPVGGVSPGDS